MDNQMMDVQMMDVFESIIHYDEETVGKNMVKFFYEDREFFIKSITINDHSEEVVFDLVEDNKEQNTELTLSKFFRTLVPFEDYAFLYKFNLSLNFTHIVDCVQYQYDDSKNFVFSFSREEEDEDTEE